MNKKLIALLILVSIVMTSESAMAQGDKEESTALPFPLRQKVDGTSKNTAEDRKIENLKLIEQKREEKRNLFDERLEKIRDEKRLTAIRKVDARLSSINAKHLESYLRILDKLEIILGKIVLRADNLKLNDIEIAEFRNLVSIAQTHITEARSSIAIQKDKKYEITFSDEKEVKEGLSEAYRALKADLAEIKSLVRTAHEAVRNVEK